MKKLSEKLPKTPGVYLMKGKDGCVLYVGKAINLRRRVESYFSRAHDSRIEKLVNEISKIDHEETDTALEALILEARLIKKLNPPYNIKEKDDKSFLYVEITNEKFPRVILARGKDIFKKRGNKIARNVYGPFASAGSIREALRVMRRIFPWNTHDAGKIGAFPKPCFDYEIGLCPGTCIGVAERKDYLKNIGRLKMFFGGKKKKITRTMERDMNSASKKLDFEKAAKLRKQIFALRHISDVAFMNESFSGEPVIAGENKRRIEGYDISNISGTSAVGSMVVFSGNSPDKSGYRKFRIKTISMPDDTGMLKEILRRRFSRTSPSGGWQLPDLILVDGGKGQIHAAKFVLRESGLRIPVIGIAKGPERKRNDFFGFVPDWTDKKTLISVRDEAHRFAVSYHRKLRGAEINNLRKSETPTT